MRKLVLVIAILTICAIAFAQDSYRQHMYTDNLNFVTPLYMPDGSTMFHDGLYWEFVLCANQTTGAQDYAADYRSSTWNLEDGAVLDAYCGLLSNVNSGTPDGFVYFDYLQKFSDPLGQPAEPNLTCGDKYYIRFYDSDSPLTATAYRTCATMTGPAVNVTDDREVSTWNDWVMLTDPHPVPAVNPIPANGATDVAITADLAWQYVVDPAHQNPTHFVVKYGTAADLTGATVADVVYATGTVDYGFALANLDYSTTYYWQIIPSNSPVRSGMSTRGAARNANTREDALSCPIWTFTTEANPVSPNPMEPGVPSPADLATNVSIDANLGWEYLEDALHQNPSNFDVYFGETPDLAGVTAQTVVFSPGVSIYTFDLPTLAYSTTYYWQVIAMNPSASTPTAIFSFTTEANPVSPNPTVAINPFPADGAVDVAVDFGHIDWSYVSDPMYTDPIGFKLYSGINPAALYAGPVVPYVTGTADYSFPIPNLVEYNTTYYWLVVPFNNVTATRMAARMEANRGDAVGCPIWSFTTGVYNGNVTPAGDPVVVDNGDGTTITIDPPAGVTGNIEVTVPPAPPAPPTYEANMSGTDLYFDITGQNQDGSAWDTWPVLLTFSWTAPVPPAGAAPACWYHDGTNWNMVAPADIVSYDFTGPVFYMTVAVNHFSTWMPGFDTTLPVELTSFNAVYAAADDCVNLSWVTASETDMQGYKVLRSENGTIDTASPVSGIIEAANSPETHHYTYSDENVVAGSTYTYWVEAIDGSGRVTYHQSSPVTIDENVVVPFDATTQLGAAYPNPFNPTVNVKFSVKEGDKATIVVYNVLGQVVKSFGTFSATKNGQTITWNGTDNNNRPVCSGVYFFKMSSNSTVAVKKVMMMK